jgi:hypothetical protein
MRTLLGEICAQDPAQPKGRHAPRHPANAASDSAVGGRPLSMKPPKDCRNIAPFSSQKDLRSKPQRPVSISRLTVNLVVIVMCSRYDNFVATD